MNTTVDTCDLLELLDQDISVAYVALCGSRADRVHCPSAANGRLVERAEAQLNDLLDRRFAAQR